MKRIVLSFFSFVLINISFAQNYDVQDVKEYLDAGDCDKAKSAYDAYVRRSNITDYGLETQINKCKSEIWYAKGIAEFEKGNYSEAVNWYSRAAEQGYAQAQYSLGECY